MQINSASETSVEVTVPEQAHPGFSTWGSFGPSLTGQGTVSKDDAAIKFYHIGF